MYFGRKKYRNWTKLLTRTCYFSQVSYALNFISLFLNNFKLYKYNFIETNLLIRTSRINEASRDANFLSHGDIHSYSARELIIICVI